MIAHEISRDTGALTIMRALLHLRREDPLEQPVERNGLHIVGFADETDLLERFDDLVTDRAGTQKFAVVTQAAAAPNGDLFGTPGDSGVAVHDIAVGVLAQTETQLEAAVLGHRHGTDLLGPCRVAGADNGNGVGDLVVEPFVGSAERADRVVHDQTSQRESESITHAGRSLPSISIVIRTRVCRPPLTSVTSTSSAPARMRSPTFTGDGKRTLSTP